MRGITSTSRHDPEPLGPPRLASVIATTPPEVLLRRLTGSLAHTLNNRLTGVIGYLDLALQDPATVGELREQLQASLACALQAATMIRQLVTFAFRPSAMEGVAAVSLRQLAEGTVARLRERPEPGLTVEFPDLSSPAVVWVNDGLVQHTVDQLIDNAIEAMPAGGTLTVRVWENAAEVCLSVADTGEGLSAEAQAHLFEPFFTTKCSGHLGLGLVLCRDLMEAQGGALHLDWEPGHGTTATLTFPADPHAPSAEQGYRLDETPPPPRSLPRGM